MDHEVEPLDGDVLNTVDTFAEILNRRAIAYAIIGGIGVLLRGRPRFTQDVDVLLQVPQIALPGLADDLKQRGFTLDPATLIREYVDVGMTGFQFGVIQVDCLKPVVPLYNRVLKTATDIAWESGRPVRVASVEGLILTKLLSFRVQDQQDIYTLLTANRDIIDLSIIREEWQPLAASYPAATQWLEGMLAKFV